MREECNRVGLGRIVNKAMQIPISRRSLCAMLPLFPAAKLLLGQQSTQAAAPAPGPASQQNPTFTIGINVVNVFATVHDKDNHIIQNLTKEDFTLQEDGRPQTISYFSRDTDLPLSLGVLVDTSRSQRTVIGEERSASYSFFEHVLREGKDQAFVLHFDHQVELLQDLTQSRQKLNKALHELEVSDDDNQQQQSGGGNNRGGGYPGGGGGRRGGGGGMRRGAGTLLYDAVYLASGDDLMKKQKGRKAVVVLSDGVDRGSKVPITEAIEAAQRSDTLVYSIYFGSNEGFPGGFGRGGGMGRGGGVGRGGGRYPQEDRPDGKKILKRISKETGGSYFEVTHKQTVDNIYSRIEEELRNQYNLGYTSDQPATQTAYRTIALTVDRKNLTVQAREGYYPAPAPADVK